MTPIDGTKRWFRLTLRGPEGKRIQWTGYVWLEGGKVHGERKTSTDAAPNDLTLHVLVADPADIMKVERQDPVYETWVTVR